MSDMVCKVSNNDNLGDNVWLGGNTVVCQSDLHALSEGIFYNRIESWKLLTTRICSFAVDSWCIGSNSRR